jgi:CDP-6-deoxy-D-xylo-4-hexulose-3-dehydrase
VYGGDRMIGIGDYKTTPKDEEVVLKILKSNRLSEGKYVREFEEKWADFCGTKYAVLTNSGTSALISALEVLKSYTNERRIHTTPLTFIATINAIVLAGFTPVFSDVNRKTFVLEPYYTGTDLFMPVHLYGFPVEMDKFNYRFMIEDACEAHGTMCGNLKAGATGIMGCFSFYIAHNIAVGDLGAITTNNKDIYLSLKQVKAHGRMCKCPVCVRNTGKCPYAGKDFDPRFTFERIAYNFKTSEIQAALAINKLEFADEILKKRNSNVQYLNNALSGTDGIQLPPHNPGISYLNYPVVITDPDIVRSEFLTKLTEEGVENRPLFSCVPTQQIAYSHLKEEWTDRLPNAEWLGERGFHCGIHEYLTREDLDVIAEAIKKCLKYRS